MKTIVVTGGGSGIGRATCVALAADKEISLIIVGRKEETLRETLKMLPRQGQHRIAKLDIRDKAQWKYFFNSINKEILNLTGVFANAGSGGENHYADTDRWDEIISINLSGTYTTIMECLPFLQQSTEDYRNIVITSSCLARFGVPNYTAYCASKAGLLGLTRALAVQLASHKILVNAICPGWVETEMAKAGIQKLANKSSIDYETSFAQQMSFVPLNKISQPEEIASFVKYLMSNEQTSITGQAIDINNGSYMN